MVLSTDAKLLAARYSLITDDAQYRELKRQERHAYTNTYDHSVRVALLTARVADALGEEDIDSAVRAALLHDFAFGKITTFRHPKDAAVNSRRFGTSPEEEAAIRAHMFPLGPIPTSRIGWSLTIADKIVAAYEGVYGAMEHYSLKFMSMTGA